MSELERMAMAEEADTLDDPIEEGEPEAQPEPEPQPVEGEERPEGEEVESQPEEVEEEEEVEEVVYEIGGKEYTPEEVEKMLEKANGADRKFQEAAEQRKQVEAILASLKDDPISAAKKLGVNIDDKIDDYVVKRMEIDALPPEQQQFYREKERIEREARELQQKQAQLQQAQLQQQADQIQRELTAVYSQALKDAGEPVTEATIAKMGFYAKQDMARGLDIKTPQSAARLVKSVRGESTEFAKHYLSKLPPEKVLEVMGKDWVKALQSYEIKKINEVKPKNNADPTTKQKGTKQRPIDEDREMTVEEFRRQLELEAQMPD